MSFIPILPATALQIRPRTIPPTGGERENTIDADDIDADPKGDNKTFQSCCPPYYFLSKILICFYLLKFNFFFFAFGYTANLKDRILLHSIFFDSH